MGDDGSSAESAPFSPQRSRPVGRRNNRSWRTSWAASHVGSVASVIYPAESTGQTERKRTSAKLLNASPLWRVSSDFTSRNTQAERILKALRISQLRRGGYDGRRNSWATTPLRQSRLCFRPAGFALSKGRNKHRRSACGGDFRQHRQCVFPPCLPEREAEKRRSRTD